MDMNSKMIKEKGTNGMERKHYETEREGRNMVRCEIRSQIEVLRRNSATEHSRT